MTEEVSCTRMHSLKKELQSSEMTFEAHVGFIAFFKMAEACVAREIPIVGSSSQGVSACEGARVRGYEGEAEGETRRNGGYDLACQQPLTLTLNPNPKP